MASRGLGTLTLDLIAKIGGFEAGMDKAARHADKRMRDIEARATKFGKVLGASLVAGAAAAVTGLIAVTKHAIDSADRLNDISERLGVSTEALSAWGYAAQQSGTDLETLNGGLTRFTKNVAAAMDAGSRQGEIFAELGVSVKDAAGNLRSVEDLLPEIATAFKDMDNATLESALSMELFGRSGAQLLQFLNLGSDGLQTMADKARDLGIIVSGETADAADEFNDQLDDLKSIMAGVGLQLAADLLPALSDFIDTVKKSAQEGGLLRFVMDDISGSAQDLANLLQDVSNKADYTAERFKAMAHVMSAAGAIMTGQFAKAQAEYQAGQAILDAQLAPKRTTPIPNLQVPFLQPLFPQFSAVPLPSPQGSSSAERRLNALLTNTPDPKKSGGGGGGKGKNDAAEALREQARQAKEAREELERLVEQEAKARESFEAMAASLAGPLADANYQYIQDQKQLNDLAKEGAIGTDELRIAQENLTAAHEKNVEAINAQLTPAQEVIAGMQEELALLGMTNEQQELYNALKYAGADATAAEAASITQLTGELQKAREARAIVDDLKNSTKDFFVDLTDGVGTAREAWDDFFDGIKRRALEFVADKAVNAFFDMLSGAGKGATGGTASSSSGGGAGFWASLAGAFFGGGRAGGGSTAANTMYRVVENGPEMLSIGGKDYLMMGSQAGHVTPTHDLAAAGGSGFNFNAQFILPQRMDSRSQMQIAQASGNAVREASRRNRGS